MIGTGQNENLRESFFDNIHAAIESIITMIERVSSHFRYTEEYVLDKTFNWLKRKYRQADKEIYEQRQVISEETMRGLLAAVTGIFGGKNANIEDMLLKPYDELAEQEHTQETSRTQFVEGQWWKKSS